MNIDAKSVKFISRLEVLFVVMALVSVAVLLMPKDYLRTSFTIDPTEYPAILVDDAYSGGSSDVFWVDKDAQRWRCEMDEVSSSPYCSIQIDVTDASNQGIDLSQFDTMTVWADYEGSATHLRIYLRNRHPNYYDPNNSITTKYNAVEVMADDLSSGLSVDMKQDFSVASWWLVAGGIPLVFSRPEFNEVSIVEVQTGSSVESGMHEIQLEKITWSGYVVEPTVLYQGVITTWTLLIVGMLIYRLLSMRSELGRQKKHQQELLAINRSLNLKSRRYEDMAKTDGLTGLSNRVGIRNILHRGMIDWRDRGADFSFIIIDLDNFKSINDTFGHDVGDKILKEASRVMLSRVRRTDALARWGGEEFVLVCPETTLDQALLVAENLRAELEASLEYRGTSITASFGVAAMSDTDLDQLFKKADNALYRAKAQGRNRVVGEQGKE
ncbi:GGDEF domain-containing protein [Marinimicrobium agarilyticum]|uniref:GGDEF domain-containing protein n=1 Tax=Marinimicrobium agarilyticum TaxID=306546 RepID=UPI00041165AF|nr:GGDEF domain-containing protein [Marinimicrobium agarilyticum]